MSDRISRKDVENAFERFTQAYNLPAGATYSKDDQGKLTANVGVYFLQRHFGGLWSIACMSNEGGGQAQMFGYRLKTTREMVECLNFANDLHYQIISKR